MEIQLNIWIFPLFVNQTVMGTVSVMTHLMFLINNALPAVFITARQAPGTRSSIALNNNRKKKLILANILFYDWLI